MSAELKQGQNEGPISSLLDLEVRERAKKYGITPEQLRAAIKTPHAKMPDMEKFFRGKK